MMDVIQLDEMDTSRQSEPRNSQHSCFVVRQNLHWVAHRVPRSVTDSVTRPRVRQIVVPEEREQTNLSDDHDSVLAGHMLEVPGSLSDIVPVDNGSRHSQVIVSEPGNSWRSELFTPVPDKLQRAVGMDSYCQSDYQHIDSLQSVSHHPMNSDKCSKSKFLNYTDGKNKPGSDIKSEQSDNVGSDIHDNKCINHASSTMNTSSCTVMNQNLISAEENMYSDSTMIDPDSTSCDAEHIPELIPVSAVSRDYYDELSAETHHLARTCNTCDPDIASPDGVGHNQDIYSGYVPSATNSDPRVTGDGTCSHSDRNYGVVFIDGQGQSEKNVELSSRVVTSIVSSTIDGCSYSAPDGKVTQNNINGEYISPCGSGANCITTKDSVLPENTCTCTVSKHCDIIAEQSHVKLDCDGNVGTTGSNVEDIRKTHHSGSYLGCYTLSKQLVLSDSVAEPTEPSVCDTVKDSPCFTLANPIHCRVTFLPTLDWTERTGLDPTGSESTISNVCSLSDHRTLAISDKKRRNINSDLFAGTNQIQNRISEDSECYPIPAHISCDIQSGQVDTGQAQNSSPSVNSTNGRAASNEEGSCSRKLSKQLLTILVAKLGYPDIPTFIMEGGGEFTIDDLDDSDWDDDDDEDDDVFFMEVIGTRCTIMDKKGNTPVPSQKNTPSGSRRTSVVSLGGFVSDGPALTSLMESLDKIELQNSPQNTGNWMGSNSDIRASSVNDDIVAEDGKKKATEIDMDSVASKRDDLISPGHTTQTHTECEDPRRDVSPTSQTTQHHGIVAPIDLSPQGEFSANIVEDTRTVVCDSPGKPVDNQNLATTSHYARRQITEAVSIQTTSVKLENLSTDESQPTVTSYHSQNGSEYKCDDDNIVCHVDTPENACLSGDSAMECKLSDKVKWNVPHVLSSSLEDLGTGDNVTVSSPSNHIIDVINDVSNNSVSDQNIGDGTTSVVTDTKSTAASLQSALTVCDSIDQCPNSQELHLVNMGNEITTQETESEPAKGFTGIDSVDNVNLLTNVPDKLTHNFDDVCVNVENDPDTRDQRSRSAEKSDSDQDSDDDIDIEFLLASDEAPVSDSEFDQLIPDEFENTENEGAAQVCTLDNQFPEVAEYMASDNDKNKKLVELAFGKHVQDRSGGQRNKLPSNLKTEEPMGETDNCMEQANKTIDGSTPGSPLGIYSETIAQGTIKADSTYQGNTSSVLCKPQGRQDYTVYGEMDESNSEELHSGYPIVVGIEMDRKAVSSLDKSDGYIYDGSLEDLDHGQQVWNDATKLTPTDVIDATIPTDTGAISDKDQLVSDTVLDISHITLSTSDLRNDSLSCVGIDHSKSQVNTNNAIDFSEPVNKIVNLTNTCQSISTSNDQVKTVDNVIDSSIMDDTDEGLSEDTITSLPGSSEVEVSHGIGYDTSGLPELISTVESAHDAQLKLELCENIPKESPVEHDLEADLELNTSSVDLTVNDIEDLDDLLELGDYTGEDVNIDTVYNMALDQDSARQKTEICDNDMDAKLQKETLDDKQKNTDSSVAIIGPEANKTCHDSDNTISTEHDMHSGCSPNKIPKNSPQASADDITRIVSIGSVPTEYLKTTDADHPTISIMDPENGSEVSVGSKFGEDYSHVCDNNAIVSPPENKGLLDKHDSLETCTEQGHHVTGSEVDADLTAKEKLVLNEVDCNNVQSAATKIESVPKSDMDATCEMLPIVHESTFGSIVQEKLAVDRDSDGILSMARSDLETLTMNQATISQLGHDVVEIIPSFETDTVLDLDEADLTNSETCCNAGDNQTVDMDNTNQLDLVHPNLDKKIIPVFDVEVTDTDTHIMDAENSVVDSEVIPIVDHVNACSTSAEGAITMHADVTFVDTEVPVADAETTAVVDMESYRVVVNETGADADATAVVDAAEIAPVMNTEKNSVMDTVDSVVDSEVAPVADSEVAPVVDSEVAPVVDSEVHQMVDAKTPVVETELPLVAAEVIPVILISDPVEDTEVSVVDCAVAPGVDSEVAEIVDTKTPVVESDVDPVVDVVVAPVVDTDVTPVVDSGVAPVLDTVASVVDTKVAPVVDSGVAPVLDTVAPVVDTEVAPVADTEAPVMDTEVAPVVDSEVAPVVDSEVAPVVDTEVAPVVDSEVAPVVDSEVAPVVDSEVAPVVDSEVAPVVDTEAPVAKIEIAQVVDTEAPVVDSEVAPVMATDTNVTAVVKTEEAPVVDSEVTPIVDSEVGLTVDIKSPTVDSVGGENVIPVLDTETTVMTSEVSVLKTEFTPVVDTKEVVNIDDPVVNTEIPVVDTKIPVVDNEAAVANVIAAEHHSFSDAKVDSDLRVSSISELSDQDSSLVKSRQKDDTDSDDWEEYKSADDDSEYFESTDSDDAVDYGDLQDLDDVTSQDSYESSKDITEINVKLDERQDKLLDNNSKSGTIIELCPEAETNEQVKDSRDSVMLCDNEHLKSSCVSTSATQCPKRHNFGTSVFSQSGAATQLPECIVDTGCQVEFSDDSDYPYYYYSSSESTPDRDLGPGRDGTRGVSVRVVESGVIGHSGQALEFTGSGQSSGTVESEYNPDDKQFEQVDLDFNKVKRMIESDNKNIEVNKYVELRDGSQLDLDSNKLYKLIDSENNDGIEKQTACEENPTESSGNKPAENFIIGEITEKTFSQQGENILENEDRNMIQGQHQLEFDTKASQQLPVVTDQSSKVKLLEHSQQKDQVSQDLDQKCMDEFISTAPTTHLVDSIPGSQSLDHVNQGAVLEYAESSKNHIYWEDQETKTVPSARPSIGMQHDILPTSNKPTVSEVDLYRSDIASESNVILDTNTKSAKSEPEGVWINSEQFSIDDTGLVTCDSELSDTDNITDYHCLDSVIMGQDESKSGEEGEITMDGRRSESRSQPPKSPKRPDKHKGKGGTKHPPGKPSENMTSGQRFDSNQQIAGKQNFMKEGGNAGSSNKQEVSVAVVDEVNCMQKPSVDTRNSTDTGISSVSCVSDERPTQANVMAVSQANTTVTQQTTHTDLNQPQPQSVSNVSCSINTSTSQANSDPDQMGHHYDTSCDDSPSGMTTAQCLSVKSAEMDGNTNGELVMQVASVEKAKTEQILQSEQCLNQESVVGGEENFERNTSVVNEAGIAAITPGLDLPVSQDDKTDDLSNITRDLSQQDILHNSPENLSTVIVPNAVRSSPDCVNNLPIIDNDPLRSNVSSIMEDLKDGQISKAVPEPGIEQGQSLLVDPDGLDHTMSKVLGSSVDKPGTGGYHCKAESNTGEFGASGSIRNDTCMDESSMDITSPGRPYGKRKPGNDIEGVLSHDILREASREDGGECVYIPEDPVISDVRPTVPEAAILSPDSGIDDLTESDSIFSDIEGRKESLATPDESEKIAMLAMTDSVDFLGAFGLPTSMEAVEGAQNVTEENVFGELRDSTSTTEAVLPVQEAVKKVTPSRFEDVRLLDEEESWRERTVVVTKADHQACLEAAQEVLSDILDNLPVENSPTKCAVVAEPVSAPKPTEPEHTQLAPVEPEPELTPFEPAPTETDIKPLAQETLHTVPPVQDPLHEARSPADPEPTVLPTQETTVVSQQELQPKVLTDQEVLPPAGSESTDNLLDRSHKEEAEAEAVVASPGPGAAAFLETQTAEASIEKEVIPTESPQQSVECDTKLDESGRIDKELLPESDIVHPSAVDGVAGLSDETPSLAVTGEASLSQQPDPETIVDSQSELSLLKENNSVQTGPLSEPSEGVKVEESLVPEPVTETESKMAEPESPIPISKGSYNIDWDNFDENINPFETKTKVMTLNNEQNETNQNTDLDLEADPFKSKTKMAISPPSSPKMSEVDPFKSKNKMANSPPPSDVDPFKSKNKMANSPPPSDVDPFKSKNKMANSPPPSDVDPFKTKNKMANSPTPSDVDPFKTKNKMANSPPSSPQPCEVDPFKTNNKMAASPTPSPVKTVKEEADINQNVESTPPSDLPDEPREGCPEDIGQPTSPRTMTSPKKKPSGGAKKGHIRFKVPRNVNQNESDEIQIYAPPPPNVSGTTDTGEAEEEFSDALPPADSSDIYLKDNTSANVSTNAQGFDIPDDEFKDASEAVFSDPADWDMLEKFGKKDNNQFSESALARQSLYVKFDPLVKGQSPEKPKPKGPFADGVESEDTLLLMGTPPPKERGPRHPAARILEAQVTKETKEMTGVLQSPTNKKAEVDKIFSCSPGESSRQGINSPSRQPDSLAASSDSLDIIQVLKYSQRDFNRMKKELELDHQARFLAKERDWQKEKENAENEIKKYLKHNEEMKTLVSEYEVTMTQLIELDMIRYPGAAEKESATSESKESMSDLIRERDQALEDLNSVENAFSDLHRRFETLKAAIEGFKKNEETLKKTVQDYQHKVKKHEEKYQALKKHAEEKLEAANQEIERVTGSSASEVTRMKAALKRAELQIQSCEQQLEQKVKENQELTAICDELINSKESGH